MCQGSPPGLSFILRVLTVTQNSWHKPTVCSQENSGQLCFSVLLRGVMSGSTADIVVCDGGPQEQCCVSISLFFLLPLVPAPPGPWPPSGSLNLSASSLPSSTPSWGCPVSLQGQGQASASMGLLESLSLPPTHSATMIFFFFRDLLNYELF